MTTTSVSLGVRFGSRAASALSLFVVLLLGACEVTVKVGGTGHVGGNDGSVGNPGNPDGGADLPPWPGDAAREMPVNVPPPPHAGLTSASKVDLVFVVDDSTSMAPLQAKMRTRMPDFMNVLKGLSGGLPDIHVGVVSSSLGAGVYGNVTGCTPGTSGNLDGNFQHKTGCGLQAGETFLKYRRDSAGVAVQNFDPGADITNVVSCIADLGQNGCGFEHQLESLRLAMQKSLVSGTENYGFLRPDAMLAVVFLTNEDDCSVAADSMLFDPNQQTVADTLGGLQSYRCAEFGHRCDQPMPHQAPGTPVTMTGCHSAEDGKLVTVQGMIEFLYTLKPGNRQNIFVGLIAGPTDPYVIKGSSFVLGNGGTESQPTLAHSCTGGAAGTEYADPPVRLAALAQAFAPNSIVTSICAGDFKDTMVNIATQMSTGQ